MYRHALATLCAAAAALVFCAAPSSAYEAGSVTDGGKISGTVKLKGTAPEPKALEVTKDKEVCGKEKVVDEALVVGAGGGIKHAVVSITNITKGKAFSEEATSGNYDHLLATCMEFVEVE